jgi:hypothetical protein
MPAALIRMSVAERERYVRWWIEKSGLTLGQLREIAGAVWSHQTSPDDPAPGAAPRATPRARGR